MAARTNAEWVEALKDSGEAQQAALADLHASLERSALFYIRRRLSTSQGAATDEVQSLAEDSAQEASLVVLDKLETFRGESRFLTWANAIAISMAMTALRRRLWRNVSLDRLPDGWQEQAKSVIHSDGWANPQMAAQRRAIWEVITEVVQTDLTERQRDVLNMVVINGVQTEVVEDRLGMSPSALYKMTHDARRKLKAGLLKRGYSTEEIVQTFALQG